MFSLNIAKSLVSSQILQHIRNEFRPNLLLANSTWKPAFTNGGNIATERQFLEVNLKHDPEKFGVESEEPKVVDEGDLREDKFFEDQPLPSQRLSLEKYAEKIQALVKKRQIKQAIDLLETRMLKEDRVKPDAYIFNLVLSALGHSGYTKKAFSLFNDMKKRGLKPTGATYTSLFNACANSPWPEDGLSRARKLQNLMVEKMFTPNSINYNAMIKAFGRHGDLPAAFQIVDEMEKKRIAVKTETINFLLQACISDKENGFRHALLIWRKMNVKKIRPDIYSYNLLLKCTRDCSIGNLDSMQAVLEEILSNSSDDFQKLKTSHSDENIGQEDNTKNKTETKPDIVSDGQDELQLRPNLLAIRPHLGNIVSLSEITRAEDRLLLIGGMRGFLQNMQDNACKPNMKTITQLLDCLPANLESEKELLNTIKRLELKADVDFYNMLIKKRSMRFDYENARSVLSLIKASNRKPDLITYGVLALACKNKEEALALIEEMESHSYQLNTEILGAMLHQACHHKNFRYVLTIMDISLERNIRPNSKFLKCLEKFNAICNECSSKKDKMNTKLKHFRKDYKIFLLKYHKWMEKIEVDKTEDEHPWTQYRSKNLKNEYERKNT